MRNHFHLLVRIKTCRVSETRQVLPDEIPETRQVLELDAREIGQRFNNLFNSYAKAINKAYNRTGSLFQKRFGRIEVTSDSYFLALINYIHRNPQKHGFVEDFRDYPYSSYHAMLSDKATRLKRDEVLAWFAGKEHFEQFHGMAADTKPIEYLVVDDYD